MQIGFICMIQYLKLVSTLSQKHFRPMNSFMVRFPYYHEIFGPFKFPVLPRIVYSSTGSCSWLSRSTMKTT
jgi:hypothetical protein